MTATKELAKVASTPAATNGKDETTTAPLIAASNQQPPAVSPAVLKNMASPKVEKDLPPLEDRLHKLDQLFELQEKYNRLKTSLQKLRDFKLKKDAESSTLTLSDENRNKFETSNPEVIAEVIAQLKQTTERKIKELEPRLCW